MTSQDGFGEVMNESKKGFTYTVSREQIDEYRAWSLDRRLKWLFYANKMRKLLPPKTIEIQEAFRQGKI
jgi:hypothetical protein